METENLTQQIPPQRTPPVHFPKAAVILGIALIALVSVFVVGAVFYFRNSTPIAKKQVALQNSKKPSNINDVFSPTKPAAPDGKNNAPSHTVIYGEFGDGATVFSSINPDTKVQKQLFSIPFNKMYPRGKENNNGKFSDIKFCSATNKIYIRTSPLIEESSSPTQPPPSVYISVKEIDLTGNIKDLDFTGTIVPYYNDYIKGSDGLLHYRNISEEFYDSTNFILSKDCQKIVWSTTYYKGLDPYENKIFLANINGSGEKVLQTTKLSTSNDLVKMPFSWSTTNPNVVYLTNFYLEEYYRNGGLFKLDLKTNSISQINTIPAENKILDISNNDNLVAYQQDSKDGGNTTEAGFFANLAQISTVPLSNVGNYSRRKFSPDNSMLAHKGRVCSFDNYGFIKDCVINLYVFDTVKKTDKLVSPDVDMKFGFLDWLTNDSVISLGNRNDLIRITQDDRNDLIMTNIKDGKITKLASVSAVFLYVGVSDK